MLVHELSVIITRSKLTQSFLQFTFCHLRLMNITEWWAATDICLMNMLLSIAISYSIQKENVILNHHIVT